MNHVHSINNFVLYILLLFFREKREKDRERDRERQRERGREGNREREK